MQSPIRCFIKALLSDCGSVSTMRLMSIIALLVGSAVGVIGVLKGKELGGVAEICAVFITSAFAAKTAQKHIEKRKE